MHSVCKQVFDICCRLVSGLIDVSAVHDFLIVRSRHGFEYIAEQRIKGPLFKGLVVNRRLLTR